MFCFRVQCVLNREKWVQCDVINHESVIRGLTITYLALGISLTEHITTYLPCYRLTWMLEAPLCKSGEPLEPGCPLALLNSGLISTLRP